MIAILTYLYKTSLNMISLCISFIMRRPKNILNNYIVEDYHFILRRNLQTRKCPAVWALSIYSNIM